MAAHDPDRDRTLRVAPRPVLLRNAALSYVLITVALFGSLYYLAIPMGTWPVLLGGQLATVAVATVAYVRYRMTYIAITDDALIERGFLSPTQRIPLSNVASVLLAQTYRSHSPDSTPQLLVRDADGRRLLRMRGAFWTDAAIHRVAETIGVPVALFPEPITSRDFFATYPGSAYWFEHRPALAVGTVVAVFVLSLAVVIALMNLAGIPISPID